MLGHLPTMVVAAMLVVSAGSAAAQTPQSVLDLLKADYDIVSISPISGSYAVFLEKDDGESVVICQIGFNAAGSAFSTDKCYPLEK